MKISSVKGALEKSRLEGRAEGHAEGLAEGRKEGRAEGRQEGEILKAKKTALKMLTKNIDVKTIMEVTDLTRTEIENL